MDNLKLTIILAMTVALAPLAIDTYLPSFPYIAKTMNIDLNALGLSVSVYMLGLATGQFFGGPFSDCWGRAKVMFLGLSLFILASVLLVFSNHLSELLVLRMLQAFGGGLALVSVPAIVRDRTEGHETAKLFGLIGLMMVIAPAIAPSIGSFILLISNWRGIFCFLTSYALLVFLLIKLFVFSSTDLKPKKTAITNNFIHQYKDVLKLNIALPFIFLQSFSHSIMFIFIANASFIYQKYFGINNFHFSIFFLFNIITMACMNRLSRILITWLSPIKIALMAIILQILAVLFLILIAAIHPSIYFIVPGLMIAVGSLGAITPNIQASYLQFYPESSGAAAGLLGTTQLTVDGGMSALSVWVANGTLMPIVLSMGICAMLNIFFMQWIVREIRKCLAN
jgi:DHA1 family bicyclomycin/chloramphenicol resistance-like MFS transporter